MTRNENRITDSSQIKKEDVMGLHGTLKTTGVLIGLALFGGCGDMTTYQPVNSGTDTPAGSFSQSQAARLAWEYRKQTNELHEAARRYELEALVKAKTLGEDSDAVRRSRQLAKEFSAAAEQVDERRFEYQRQVPHGQVY
jgi:hypothetical protein